MQNDFSGVASFGIPSPIVPPHVDTSAVLVTPGAEYKQYEDLNAHLTGQMIPGSYLNMPSDPYYEYLTRHQGYEQLPYNQGVAINPTNQDIAYAHNVHVPIFRTRKRIYIKKQSEGCCGCINGNGYFDKPGGFLCFPLCNVAGCLDRESVVKVDRFGRPARHKKTYTHNC